MIKRPLLSVMITLICIGMISGDYPSIPQFQAMAQTVFPTVWDILADDFESGALDLWRTFLARLS